MNSHAKYVLIGGGLTSSSAAEEIRQRDPAGSIIVISQESEHPYHRPPLSKSLLAGQSPREELFTHPEQWYSQSNIDLRRGRRAVAIDTNRKSVRLDDGQTVIFDKLLIATGGAARQLNIPGSNLPNLHYVRQLRDMERLQKDVARVKASGHQHERGRGIAVVIGAELLGVELAVTLTQLGLAVHLVAPHAHPWNNIAGAETGAFLARHLQAHQIKIHPNARATALEGSGQIQRVVLNTGEKIETDLVVAAAGMQVNLELVHNTSIKSDRAILTDASTRTNVADVYAAGDCAAIFDPLFGKYRLIEHWDHAQRVGKLAGANMAGGHETYDAVNYFFSDIFEIALAAWGEARQVHHRLIRTSTTNGITSWFEIGLDDHNRVVQVLALRTGGDEPDLSWLVRQHVDVTGREEQFKNPAVPFEQLR
ncbi:MAG: NAD(P)/FAD-dependent oxidoreductase [Phycisphaerales bacterium]|nr:NAD(P)/FAD-dependent oxidoreductase [Phycisphaerales bacterium]